MGNVTCDGRLDLGSLKYLPQASRDLARYTLMQGDLLFNRTNSKELVGKTGLWDGRMEAVAASYFIRVRLGRHKLLPEYAWVFFNTPFMKRRLFDTARGAIGQANINAKELKAFPIPLPPLRLQEEFANRVASLRRLEGQHAKAAQADERATEAVQAHLFSN